MPAKDLIDIFCFYLGQTEESMKVEIGYIHCPLEGRFTQIRTRECNLGECTVYLNTKVVLSLLFSELLSCNCSCNI